MTMTGMETIESHNQETLASLLWAVEMCRPETFTLIFAQCDSRARRSRLAAEFKQQCQLTVHEVELPPTTTIPYKAVHAALQSETVTKSPVLFVYGLDNLAERELALKSLNNTRELFQHNCPCPVVFWLTAATYKPLVRIAKDIDSWGKTLTFEVGATEQLAWLIQAGERAFEIGLQAGAIPHKSAILQTVGDRQEVLRAWQTLQERDLPLEPAAEARVQLLLALLGEDSEQAGVHYSQSLAAWQACELSPTVQTHAGLTQYYLGQWWVTQAYYNRAERETAFREARKFWQRAVLLWEQAERLDLVARFINPIGELLAQLHAWTELAELSELTTVLHQQYPHTIWQAHDLGILAAEGAIARQDWSTALTHAQAALILLDQAQEPGHEWAKTLHRGWYLLLLAIAQWQLGEQASAIGNLDTARKQTNPQANPYLYFRILGTLQDYYFENQRYLEAFEVKQQFQLVEFQFNFRAFVGASQLNLRRYAHHRLSDVERRRLVNRELQASGREHNVTELVARIKRKDHRLTIIHGASGVGKSSLIQAALCPMLRQTSVETRDILPVVQSVYSDWSETLAESIIDAFEWSSLTVRNGFNHESPLAIANSLEHILAQLRQNTEKNLLTVLIFDQFEEFLLAHPDFAQRLPFYSFLRDALNIPAVKVILSMRSDYLHHLLECNDPGLVGLDVVNHDILSRNVLYYLGQFSRQQARDVMESLTAQARFSLAPDLIEALVTDLAGRNGKVRPIELQIVGAQIQSEKITTLEQYAQISDQHDLVMRYLEDAVRNCGSENEEVAWQVLGLLIDKQRDMRLLRSRSDLEASLGCESEQLDLILEILQGSRLIFSLEDTHQEERYQLIHDYLVDPIREIVGVDLVVKLARIEAESATMERVNALLNEASQTARQRLSFGTGILIITLLTSLGVALHTGKHLQEVNSPQRLPSACTLDACIPLNPE